MSWNVEFNVPWLSGLERDYISQALKSGRLQGDGSFTRRCHAWIESRIGVEKALLTNSCTTALEMAALMCKLEPGDEVILPSFTFSSTANAAVLRGAIPVFVDIRPDTLNIDEGKIEEAITSRTKAIFVVHYAGVCAEMDQINRIARRRGLMVVEDAAQALLSTYRHRPAGQLGDIACFSFHATKNIVSGEGGAFVTRRAEMTERAHIIWEKGTNRRRFLEGQVDKYTWVDVGSSFLPSEITAAFLLAQLENAENITADRIATWQLYQEAFAGLEAQELVTRPVVPDHCGHNGHLYYLIMRSRSERDALIAALAASGIPAPFHYVPLHSSPAGLRYGRAHGDLAVTNDMSERLIRLPLYAGIGHLAESVIDRVREHVPSGAVS